MFSEKDLNEKESRLFERLAAIPPDFPAAEQLLQENPYSSQEITRIALAYAWECSREVCDFEQEHGVTFPAGICPGLHSTYIVEIIRLLLEHGLDPNDIYDDENIMDRMQYIDNELLGADALRLLLEKGGDPDLNLPREPLFEAVDFDVFFAAIEQYNRPFFTSNVHCWMVLLGYRTRYWENCMQRFREYDSPDMFVLSKLKDHRKYSFALIRLEDGFAISIFDKETLWEVARFLN